MLTLLIEKRIYIFVISATFYLYLREAFMDTANVFASNDESASSSYVQYSTFITERSLCSCMTNSTLTPAVRGI